METFEEGDEPGLARARSFARERVFERAWISGALEVDSLRKRSEFRQVLCEGRLLGLAAQIRGVLPYQMVSLAALLPRVARALLEGIDRPFVCPVPERNAPEVAAAGGRLMRTELDMVRLHRAPLPEADPRVERLEDSDEILRFAGRAFADFQLELGPFFGVRDARGALAAVGGVRFVTDRLALLAHVETREDFRRQGLARGVVVELVRALETPTRSVMLQVREANQAARWLYSELDFRGSRRIWRYSFGNA